MLSSVLHTVLVKPSRQRLTTTRPLSRSLTSEDATEVLSHFCLLLPTGTPRQQQPRLCPSCCLGRHEPRREVESRTGRSDGPSHLVLNITLLSASALQTDAVSGLLRAFEREPVPSEPVSLLGLPLRIRIHYIAKRLTKFAMQYAPSCRVARTPLRARYQRRRRMGKGKKKESDETLPGVPLQRSRSSKA